MNRLTIPLLILLGSLLFSWAFNSCFRSKCDGQQAFSQQNCCDNNVAMAPPPVPMDTLTKVDTTHKVLTAEEQVLFKPLDLYFTSGNASIKRTAKIDSFLTTAKKYFAKYPDEKLSVDGYTDSDGSEASNLILSKKRAQMVANVLQKDGFKAANLLVDGKGELNPLVENNTEANKATNRRVSIRLIK